ncbi:MAG: hypothetical protein M1837_000146 [Sclerophora amabilis]|nr:MAG: hypothetical protein M1837_000146 [Sclerophora amabilis]
MQLTDDQRDALVIAAFVVMVALGAVGPGLTWWMWWRPRRAARAQAAAERSLEGGIGGQHPLTEEEGLRMGEEARATAAAAAKAITEEAERKAEALVAAGKSAETRRSANEASRLASEAIASNGTRRRSGRHEPRQKDAEGSQVN